VVNIYFSTFGTCRVRLNITDPFWPLPREITTLAAMGEGAMLPDQF